jgi:hypothetical protein
VLIQVWIGVVPQILFDGFITRTEMNPGDRPGSGTFVVTGEDVRVMMDMQEVSLPHTGLADADQVQLILAKYMLYLGAPPVVVQQPPLVAPLPSQAIPVQTATDLRYIEGLGAQRDFVFYVEPTDVPMQNLAYWGPPQRASVPQPALTINMGHESNASIQFSYDALKPTLVVGAVQDKDVMGLVTPIVTVTSTRFPPLVPLPALPTQLPNVRTTMPRGSGGLSATDAMARAQATTDRSTDVVTATGQLDMMRYGSVLRPRRLVGVRGAGWQYDGLYYVSQVTHRIKKAEYSQSFTLTREGLGSLTPVLNT